ncbi:BA75_03750T0 [Komagataella pastoris]|uniref:BA75_03750T0 n=1 Tax=Komagataella pastoris TaxID=4922 RepID=A0A1B2JER4_PICPA|nr:BA75_03750T0 [Komagataella pastoris]
MLRARIPTKFRLFVNSRYAIPLYTAGPAHLLCFSTVTARNSQIENTFKVKKVALDDSFGPSIQKLDALITNKKFQKAFKSFWATKDSKKRLGLYHSFMTNKDISLWNKVALSYFDLNFFKSRSSMNTRIFTDLLDKDATCEQILEFLEYLSWLRTESGIPSMKYTINENLLLQVVKKFPRNLYHLFFHRAVYSGLFIPEETVMNKVFKDLREGNNLGRYVSEVSNLPKSNYLLDSHKLSTEEMDNIQHIYSFNMCYKLINNIIKRGNRERSEAYLELYNQKLFAYQTSRSETNSKYIDVTNKYYLLIFRYTLMFNPSQRDMVLKSIQDKGLPITEKYLFLYLEYAQNMGDSQEFMSTVNRILKFYGDDISDTAVSTVIDQIFKLMRHHRVSDIKAITGYYCRFFKEGQDLLTKLGILSYIYDNSVSRELSNLPQMSKDNDDEIIVKTQLQKLRYGAIYTLADVYIGLFRSIHETHSLRESTLCDLFECYISTVREIQSSEDDAKLKGLDLRTHPFSSNRLQDKILKVFIDEALKLKNLELASYFLEQSTDNIEYCLLTSTPFNMIIEAGRHSDLELSVRWFVYLQEHEMQLNFHAVSGLIKELTKIGRTDQAEELYTKILLKNCSRIDDRKILETAANSGWELPSSNK